MGIEFIGEIFDLFWNVRELGEYNVLKYFMAKRDDFGSLYLRLPRSYFVFGPNNKF